MKLKDLIENKTAEFQYYRDNNLWYSVDLFLFPVPISDIGNATFNKTEKAILLMRYIKKWKAVLEETEKEHESPPEVIKHDGGVFPNGHPWRK